MTLSRVASLRYYVRNSRSVSFFNPDPMGAGLIVPESYNSISRRPIEVGQAHGAVHSNDTLLFLRRVFKQGGFLCVD